MSVNNIDSRWHLKTPVVDGPDDFKLYYYTNEDGHVWLNAKNSPILLTEPLVGHIDSKDPQELWHSKVTRKGFFLLSDSIQNRRHSK